MVLLFKRGQNVALDMDFPYFLIHLMAGITSIKTLSKIWIFNSFAQHYNPLLDFFCELFLDYIRMALWLAS